MRKILTRTAGLLLLSASATALALHGTGCSKETLPPARQDTIPIGLLVSQSGNNRGVGGAIERGTRVAVDLINSNGGVLGRQLELVIKDDASDNSELKNPDGTPVPNAGVVLQSRIDELLNQNVVAILGPGATVQVLEAEKRVWPRDDAGTPLSSKKPPLMISAWATSPRVTIAQGSMPNRYLFRTAPSDTGQRRALFKMMTDGAFVTADGGVVDGGGNEARPGTPHNCVRPALVYGDDALGQAFEEYLRPQFKNKGLQYESYPVQTNEGTDASYNPTIDKIIAYKPDCIGMVIYEGVGKGFVPLLKRRTTGVAGFENTFYIGTDALKDQKFLDDIRNQNPPGAANGMFGIVPNTKPGTPMFNEFRNIYRTLGDTVDGAAAEPADYSTNAFDAVILLALAIQKAKTATDPDAIKLALVDVSREPTGIPITPATLDQAFARLASGGAINYEGASGDVDFDPFGDVKGDYVTWTIKNGAFVDLVPYLEKDLPQ